MKKLIMKILAFAAMGCLLLSCAKKTNTPFDAFLEAHNNFEVARAMKSFAPDAEMKLLEGWDKNSAEEIQALAEFQAGTKHTIRLENARINRDTLWAEMFESSEFYKLVDIEKVHSKIRVIFVDEKIVRFDINRQFASEMEIKQKFKPFTSWAVKNRTEKWVDLLQEGKFKYGYDGAKGWLALLNDWRENRDK